jgi:hypothetical protein
MLIKIRRCLSMAIKQLQADIKKGEGYILSDGTLNLQHLLPKAYDLIKGYNLKTNLKKDICSVLNHNDPTFYNQYYGNVKLESNKEEEASYLWNEDIYNYLNNISPKGYYFGSSEGDGACIGFFRYNEEE